MVKYKVPIAGLLFSLLIAVFLAALSEVSPSQVSHTQKHSVASPYDHYAWPFNMAGYWISFGSNTSVAATGDAWIVPTVNIASNSTTLNFHDTWGTFTLYIPGATSWSLMQNLQSVTNLGATTTNDILLTSTDSDLWASGAIYTDDGVFISSGSPVVFDSITDAHYIQDDTNNLRVYLADGSYFTVREASTDFLSLNRSGSTYADDVTSGTGLTLDHDVTSGIGTAVLCPALTAGGTCLRLDGSGAGTDILADNWSVTGAGTAAFASAAFGGGYGNTGMTVSDTGYMNMDGVLTVNNVVNSNTGTSTFAVEEVGGGYLFTGITLLATGSLSMAGDLIVDGTSTVGGMAAGTGTFTNGVTIGGGYGSTGVTVTTDGDVKMNGKLTVDGDIDPVNYYGSGFVAASGSIRLDTGDPVLWGTNIASVSHNGTGFILEGSTSTTHVFCGSTVGDDCRIAANNKEVDPSILLNGNDGIEYITAVASNHVFKAGTWTGLSLGTAAAFTPSTTNGTAWDNGFTYLNAGVGLKNTCNALTSGTCVRTKVNEATVAGNGGKAIEVTNSSDARVFSVDPYGNLAATGSLEIDGTSNQAGAATFGSTVNITGNLTASFASMTSTISAAQHGDLSASTATMHSATSVTVTDGGGYFASINVEDALQEVGATLTSIQSGTINSWGGLMKRDSGAPVFASPTEFSNHDADFKIPSTGGSLLHSSYLQYGSGQNNSVMIGVQYTAAATVTTSVVLGGHIGSGVINVYLDGDHIFRYVANANGEITTVPYAASPHSAVENSPSGISTLTFELPTGTHVIEFISYTDTNGLFRTVLYTPWLDDPDITSWTSYTRY